MKRIYLTLVAIIAVAQVSNAQWSSGTGTVFPTTLTDKIGIGTASPLTSLHINGTFMIDPTGSNYNEGIRIHPSSANDYSTIVLGAVSGTTGTGAGQWAIVRAPAASNYLLSIGYNGSQSLNITNDGKVGMGTTAPTSALNVARGGTNATTDYPSINISTTAAGNIYGPILYLDGSSGINGRRWGLSSSGVADAGSAGAAGNFSVYDGTAGTSRLVINGSGDTGIGTTSPDAKLTVNGTVHSKEVRVDLSVPYPDYVFKPTYKLPTIKSVKAYIDQNHHLPNMPSERDVAKNGLNLGEMNTLLTKKVEELTLYLIKQQKEIDVLQRQVRKTFTIHSN